MGSKAQPAGKTWWEQQRTGLSRLIAVLAFLVVALTESRWELHQEPVAWPWLPSEPQAGSGARSSSRAARTVSW